MTAKAYRLNPFDLTKVWPHGDYPLHEVGKLVLDRNAKLGPARRRRAQPRQLEREENRPPLCTSGDLSSWPAR
jgi:hypothetical protein